jgi:hypothetical protein
MAGRGPQSFKKRQKEQQRKEKQQEKLAKRIERRNAPPTPEDPLELLDGPPEIDAEEEAETESVER